MITPPSTQLSLADLFEMNVPEEAQPSEPEAEVEDNTVAGPAEITAENSEPETADGTLSPGSGEMVIPGSGEQEPGPVIPQQDISNGFSSWAESDMRQDTLQPLSGPAAAEYNELKNRYPDSLVGFEQNGFYEFYGEDARRVAELMDMELLRKTIPGGQVDVTGFEASRWPSEARLLWSAGNSIYLAGENEDGTHHETKYFRGEDFLPINAEIHINDRDYRIDSVDFVNGTVSLQDMTMAREARYPLFRTESVDYVRSYYEEQHPDPAPVIEVDATEITDETAVESSASEPSAQERTAQETPENVYDGETNTQEPGDAEETEEGVKRVLFREIQAVLHRLKMKLKRLLSHRPGFTTSASRMTTLALAA